MQKLSVNLKFSKIKDFIGLHQQTLERLTSLMFSLLMTLGNHSVGHQGYQQINQLWFCELGCARRV